MNTTNAASLYTNGTESNPLGNLFDSFVNPIIVIRIYQIGYPIIFLLGFIGNIASFLTFSRPTLIVISTGCLFLMLSISDTLYLLICVLDFVEFGLQIRLYNHISYNELCRFRSFVKSAAQLCSIWILVLISIDRWIRTRFPYKSMNICTPKKSVLAIVILIIIDIAMHSHMLTPMFGTVIPGLATAACGSSGLVYSYTIFYWLQWFVIQTVTTCLIPIIVMILILIDIFINVRIRKRAVIQPVQMLNMTNQFNRQRNIQKQMFILMFTSICIFALTNLPLSIYKIISQREGNFMFTILRLVSVSTGLEWLQSLNHAINFYVHCLTSTLFRKEFLQQMKCLYRTRPVQINVIKLTRVKTSIQHNPS